MAWLSSDRMVHFLFYSVARHARAIVSYMNTLRIQLDNKQLLPESRLLLPVFVEAERKKKHQRA